MLIHLILSIYLALEQIVGRAARQIQYPFCVPAAQNCSCSGTVGLAFCAGHHCYQRHGTLRRDILSVSLDLDLTHSNQCQATLQELPTGLGSDCLTDSGDLRSLAQHGVNGVNGVCIAVKVRTVRIEIECCQGKIRLWHDDLRCCKGPLPYFTTWVHSWQNNEQENMSGMKKQRNKGS